MNTTTAIFIAVVFIAFLLFCVYERLGEILVVLRRLTDKH